MSESVKIYNPVDPQGFRDALVHVANLQAELEEGRSAREDRIALALCRRGEKKEP